MGDRCTTERMQCSVTSTNGRREIDTDQHLGEHVASTALCTGARHRALGEDGLVIENRETVDRDALVQRESSGWLATATERYALAQRHRRRSRSPTAARPLGGRYPRR